MNSLLKYLLLGALVAVSFTAILMGIVFVTSWVWNTFGLFWCIMFVSAVFGGIMGFGAWADKHFS